MLHISHLDKIYPNGVHALSGIDLDVRQGESVAIVGGSGCGKSTLLRLIVGLDHASHGDITVDGQRIQAPHPAVGIVFQEPRLLPWLSIADNIAFYIDNLPAAERRARVQQALELIGLKDYGKRWPRELSGGQAQRVAIARSLVAQPKILLLDEPFSALDAFTRASLQESLLELWSALDLTLIIVTHDVEEAVLLAERILVMKPHPGQIFESLSFDLPYPRERLSDPFVLAERQVLASLNASLKHPASRTAPQQAAG